jgi:RNA polymerase sigma factor (sigma-70 family)
MSTITTATICHDSASDLVRAARDGDARAMENIIDCYANVVWATVRSVRLDEADVHDAVQNTWLQMLEHLGDLRDAERLPGWLATTARREALRISRHRQREMVGLSPGATERADRATPGPEHEVIDRAMHGLLWTQVADLPPAARQMLMALTGAEAPSYADFARSSGMPVGSIGPRRMRYLHHLRQLLERSGLGLQAWR